MFQESADEKDLHKNEKSNGRTSSKSVNKVKELDKKDSINDCCLNSSDKLPLKVQVLFTM